MCMEGEGSHAWETRKACMGGGGSTGQSASDWMCDNDIFFCLIRSNTSGPQLAVGLPTRAAGSPSEPWHVERREEPVFY